MFCMIHAVGATLCCIGISWLAFCPAPARAFAPVTVAADDAAEAAATLTKEASTASRAKDFDAAVTAYVKAIEKWKEYLRDHAHDRDAQQQLSKCQSDLDYCLDKPIRLITYNAAKLFKDGQPRAGSDEFLKAAEMYQRANKITESSRFQRSRVYCLDRAALEPIRFADKVKERGEYQQAAELYQLGIDRYTSAETLLGENRFTRNIEYATLHRSQCCFAALLEAHGVAPDFDLEGTKGQRVRLSSFRGKPVLLVLWAGWCGVCRGELPELEALYRDSAERGLVVLGVCLDSVESWDRGGRGKAKELMEQTLTFPVGWATEQTVLDYGSPNAVPTFIWIDAQGNLVRQIPSKEVRIIRLLREFEALQSNTSARVKDGGQGQ